MNPFHQKRAQEEFSDSSCAQLVEKPINKSFGRAFSKARRVEGQRPSSLPAGSEISCLHQKDAKEGGIGGGKTRVFSPPILNLSYICFKCSLKKKIFFRQKYPHTSNGVCGYFTCASFSPEGHHNAPCPFREYRKESGHCCNTYTVYRQAGAISMQTAFRDRHNPLRFRRVQSPG